MASDLELLIKQRDEARAAVEKMDAAITKHESPAELEQRELARAEYLFELFRGVALDHAVWDELAGLARPNGEEWLFERAALKHDRELRQEHAAQAGAPRRDASAGA